ncbi:hypothetical protein JX265_009287 [Neoarthrinium moseri]|uniref:Uncharacterized protein n=1 Tax=Neoarthrinium moseri TaxID=1658444 RepID=A0A9P9WGC3_9PEZI|nr:uncharacterized protein JN550_012426 [Neoarthrinium moseri]KAI1840137.1 hypothetical protein JX266_013656 [Neoarthrinium moseri]KAI1858772.1 hypothetical protein JN550_012426 [Neoarthrinium moseri]KAI1861784.1 hypothetical protein JX265_009287 [Neoarthrinium moseri]
MTSPRTLLGPLTTTWTAPAVCSYYMALGCSTCNTGWQGQTCNSASNAHDWTDCWPPRASSMMDPGVMMGWGFYSPGIACPEGYTTAAMATEGGSTGWGLEYELTQGETAAACCPTGFTPSSITAAGTYAATCLNVATTSTFSTVACRSGQFQDFSRIEIPNGDIKTFTVFAPLIQLNFQSSDLPATSSAAETAGGGGGASPSSTGQSLPSITGMSGSSTASDPVASLIPSSLRTSATALGSSGHRDDNKVDDEDHGGLATGAKIGIGVGVGVGAFLLIVIAFLIWRSRRKAKKVGAEDEKGAGGFGGGIGGLGRKKSKRAELAGNEVLEMEGNKTQELPATALSVGEPRQPAAIFELEASTPLSSRLHTPTSRANHAVVSPATPTPPDNNLVSPITPTRASYEDHGNSRETRLRNEAAIHG